MLRVYFRFHRPLLKHLCRIADSCLTAFLRHLTEGAAPVGVSPQKQGGVPAALRRGTRNSGLPWHEATGRPWPQ
jgi:hypothetical protein